MKETPELHLPPSQRGEHLERDTPRLRRWLRPSAWPYRLSYPVLGSLLALGSPAGFLLLRAILGHLDLSAPAIREEIASQPLTYGYLLGSSLLAFTLLGWGLGRKEDALKAASATDPLTGLWNRRYLHARLTQEVRRAARHQSPLSLLLIDLDHLKSINDRDERRGPRRARCSALRSFGAASHPFCVGPAWACVGLRGIGQESSDRRCSPLVRKRAFLVLFAALLWGK